MVFILTSLTDNVNCLMIFTINMFLSKLINDWRKQFETVLALNWTAQNNHGTDVLYTKQKEIKEGMY